MGPRQSQPDVLFYIRLLENVLADSYGCYPEIPSRERNRDIATIRSRCFNEGFSFLTKTLPLLGKALDQALETGQLTVPNQFSRKRIGGKQWNIPKLFSALFLTIFDEQGHLRPGQKGAVGMIRQLCFCCYKVELPFTAADTAKYSERFKTVDASLPDCPSAIPGRHTRVFRHARMLLRKLFAGFDPANITPGHGPGAVAERLKGRKKYDFTFYDPQIDQLYPYVQYATFGIHTQNPDDLLRHLALPRGKPPSRVCFVPKDSRGPRVISCEPSLLQYLQQGLAREIYRLVESNSLTRGHVLFTDQSIHRELAMRSSRDGHYATLDMRDASDRVSWALVQALFPEELVSVLAATRSEATVLPNGEVVRLKKFAPMGSALCFPIEALTFWALTTAVIGTVSRGRATSRRPVFVYGDDIIVEAKHAELVISELEAFSLQFNRDKCFIRGNFRESCGCDAFLSEDVTPVRIRVLRTSAPAQQFKDLYRLSKNAQTFFDHGYWETAEYLWKYVEQYTGRLPVTDSEFPGISRSSTLPFRGLPFPRWCRTRMNRDLQRNEIRTVVLRARRYKSTFSREVLRLGHNLLQGMARPFDESVADPHTAIPKVEWVRI